MSTVAVEAQGSIAAIAEEWEELADRVGASPFVRPGWFAAWLEAFGDGEPLVLAVRDGERLAGVLALVGGRGRLRSPTNTHTPVFDLVAEDAEVARRLAVELLERRFQQLDLAYLDPAGPLFKAVSGVAAAEGRGPRLLSRSQMRSPYVPLHGDFDAFRAGLSRNFRRQLDRRQRRVGELGELTFEFTDGGDDLEGLLDVGFELEASGWKVGEGTAILASPLRIRFYRELASWARSRGWLTLAFARLDGRPIAFDLCIEQGGRTYALKGGYDPEFAKYGVSFLLIGETIRRGYDLGHESYELLGDADDYKLQLTGEVRERVVLQAFGRGPAGYARYLGYARVRPWVRRLR